MDFRDTEDEAAFREEARSWLDQHAEPLSPGETRAPVATERERPGAIERAQAWMAEKADDGWACITWPVDFGGRGASRIQNVIWQQEEARYRVPPNLFTIGQGMLGPTLMEHGSEEQKRRYLQPMLRADEIWCQLFSEPGAGSDLAGLRTRAVRDGDEWVVDGQKIWTSGAHYSDWGMIVTRSDPHAAKHAGITYFIVDMKAPGIEMRPVRQMNDAAGFNEVFFTGCRIPDANRIGAVDDGWRCAITTLMNERATIGGGGAGGPDWNGVLRLARSLHSGEGRSLLEDTSVRQRLAEFYVTLKGLEYTGYRNLTALSRGATPGPSASLGKLVGGSLRQQLAAFALELQGMSAAIMEPELLPEADDWQQSFLSAPGMRLAGGTDEILRNIIAERVLGLPGEARSDKGVPFEDIPAGVPRQK